MSVFVDSAPMRIECPKCNGHSAWLKMQGHDTILRCMCGLHRVVHSTLEVAPPPKPSKSELKLPKRETNLWFTLVTLAALEQASSAAVTHRLLDLGKGFSTSDVASYLTILRTKSLVYNVDVRRGVLGGSTWEISPECANLLGLKVEKIWP